MKKISQFFRFQENETTFSREILAGVVIFVTMVYVVCLQPAIMSGALVGINTGMDRSALVSTTCLAIAFGCILMGVLARYPFALGPAMGTNFFVVCELFPSCATTLGLSANSGAPEIWALGLAVVFFSGVLFFLLSVCQVRKWLLTLLSPSMKAAICGGVGIFIAVIGLQNGKILVVEENQLRMGALLTPEVGTFALGLLVSVVLYVRRVPGALLWGILVAATLAFGLGKFTISQFVCVPADPRTVIGHLDYVGVWKHLPDLWAFIFILTFMSVFDEFGSFVSLLQQVNLPQSEELPRIKRVFLADAGSTIFGSFCGHSTMTLYIESAAGISTGGKTGLTSIVVGVLFLFALFFSPLIMAVGSYLPVTACVLVVVGIMMMQSLKYIAWGDFTELVPAFVIIVGIPFFNSISNGILCGTILYPLLKLFTGRVRDTTPGMFILAGVMLAYLLLV